MTYRDEPRIDDTKGPSSCSTYSTPPHFLAFRREARGGVVISRSCSNNVPLSLGDGSSHPKCTGEHDAQMSKVVGWSHTSRQPSSLADSNDAGRLRFSSGSVSRLPCQSGDGMSPVATRTQSYPDSFFLPDVNRLDAGIGRSKRVGLRV